MITCSENLEYDNFKFALLTAVLTFCVTKFTSIFRNHAILRFFRLLNVLFIQPPEQQREMSIGVMNALNQHSVPGADQMFSTQRQASVRSQRDRDTLDMGIE